MCLLIVAYFQHYVSYRHYSYKNGAIFSEKLSSFILMTSYLILFNEFCSINLSSYFSYQEARVAHMITITSEFASRAIKMRAEHGDELVGF